MEGEDYSSPALDSPGEDSSDDDDDYDEDEEFLMEDEGKNGNVTTPKEAATGLTSAGLSAAIMGEASPTKLAAEDNNNNNNNNNKRKVSVSPMDSLAQTKLPKITSNSPATPKVLDLEVSPSKATQLYLNQSNQTGSDKADTPPSPSNDPNQAAANEKKQQQQKQQMNQKNTALLEEEVADGIMVSPELGRKHVPPIPTELIFNTQQSPPDPPITMGIPLGGSAEMLSQQSSSQKSDDLKRSRSRPRRGRQPAKNNENTQTTPNNNDVVGETTEKVATDTSNEQQANRTEPQKEEENETPSEEKQEETMPSNHKGKKKKGPAAKAADDKKGNDKDKKTAAKAEPKGQKRKQPASKDSASGSGNNAAASKGSKANGPAVKKQKKRTFQDELMHHMFLSCRPFNIKELAQHMKSTESAVNFCLLSLVDKQWVIKKEFVSKGGRSKDLYWANQEAKAKELESSLRLVSREDLHAAIRELKEVQQQEVALAHELAQVKQEPSNDELEDQIKAAEEQVKELAEKVQETRKRVNKASSGGKGKVSQKQIKKRFNKMRAEWKNRKEKCTDFIEQLADGMEKKVKDVIKLLELETDEMLNQKLPPKYLDVEK